MEAKSLSPGRRAHTCDKTQATGAPLSGHTFWHCMQWAYQDPLRVPEDLMKHGIGALHFLIIRE